MDLGKTFRSEIAFCSEQHMFDESIAVHSQLCIAPFERCCIV